MEARSHLGGITLISGGQTGIDRAILDFCIQHNIPCGGWCPAGRLAEDGMIDPSYPLIEIESHTYKARTEINVEKSDGTVVIYSRTLKGGTLLSFDYAKQRQKPILLLDMSTLNISEATRHLQEFLLKSKPNILNFSGPRLSEWPQGYQICQQILHHLHPG